jgi:hypothetical protein
MALLKEGNCALFERLEAVTDPLGLGCRVILLDIPQSRRVRESIREMGGADPGDPSQDIEWCRYGGPNGREGEEALGKVEGLEDTTAEARRKVEEAARLARLPFGSLPRLPRVGNSAWDVPDKSGEGLPRSK